MNSTSSLSWTAVSFAAIVIGHSYFSSRTPPITFRPPLQEMGFRPPDRDGMVQARLWQDPVDAGKRRFEEIRTAMGENAEVEFGRLWDYAREHNRLDRNALRISIVVHGGAFPENHEYRLRYRLAVHEAMEALGYRPADWRELRFVPLAMVWKEDGSIGVDVPSDGNGKDVARESAASAKSAGSTGTDTGSSREYVPLTYELFERKTFDAPIDGAVKKIAVHWIPDSLVDGGRDYTALKGIDAALVEEPPAGGVAVEEESTGRHEVVSMQGSDALLQLLANAKADSSMPRVHFAAASAPAETIRAQTEDFEKRRPAIEAVAKQIIRTTASDDVVLGVVVDELQRRIPGFGSYSEGEKPLDRVWLISEQDMFYSQVMEGQFRSILECRDLEVDLSSIGYLKGIDGNLPDDPSVRPSRPAGSPTQLGLEELAMALTEQRAPQQLLSDRRQVDYLQRLAAALQQRERGSFRPRDRVKAIGFLGGDIYDKVLAMQIFRERFPAVHCFTTDMDALYLYGPNATVARNLIVATPFGLRVPPGGDETIAVFRNSLQSSLYHTILRVVRNESGTREMSTRLFEVGSRMFQRLSPSEGAGARREKWRSGESLWDQLDSEETGAGERVGPPPDGVPTRERPLSLFGLRGVPPIVWLLAGAVAVFLPCLGARRIAGALAGAVRRLRAIESRVEKRLRRSAGIGSGQDGGVSVVRGRNAVIRMLLGWAKDGLARRLALGLLGFVLAMAALIVFDRLSDEWMEPVSWDNGVSAWPSILLRFAMFGFGLWLLIGNLGRERRSPAIKELRHRCGLEAEISWGSDVWLIGIYTLVFLPIAFLCGIVLLSEHSDGFFTPARGRWAFFFHDLSVMLCFPVTVMLMWWAALRHDRGCELLRKLAEGRSRLRDEFSGREKGEAWDLPATTIRDLDQYMSAIGESVLPPFALMILLLLSRHRMLDAWNIPIGLILILALMLLILLAYSYRLSRAAQRFKKLELARLDLKGKPEKEKLAATEKRLWEGLAGPFGSYKDQPMVKAAGFAALALGLTFIDPLLRALP